MMTYEQGNEGQASSRRSFSGSLAALLAIAGKLAIAGTDNGFQNCHNLSDPTHATAAFIQYNLYYKGLRSLR